MISFKQWQRFCLPSLGGKLPSHTGCGSQLIHYSIPEGVAVKDSPSGPDMLLYILAQLPPLGDPLTRASDQALPCLWKPLYQGVLIKTLFSTLTQNFFTSNPSTFHSP